MSEGEPKTLERILEADVVVTVKTGLKIGGPKDSVEIGGLDQPVIRMAVADPVAIFGGDNELTDFRFVPYIPGSSLKGRMRGLLEVSNRFDKDMIKKVFGYPSNKSGEITRLMVDDLIPDKETIKAWKSAGLDIERELEVKMENQVSRLTGKAEHPRQIERVPAGSRFEGKLKLLVFSEDNVEEFKKMISSGIELINATYLGGSGSRGYGRVKIELGEWKEIWPQNR